MLKEDKLLKIEAAISKDELVPIQDNSYAFSSYIQIFPKVTLVGIQELCESWGGRPGLSVLTSLWFSWTLGNTEPCFGIGHNLSLICQTTSEDMKLYFIIINVTSVYVTQFISAILGSCLSICEVIFFSCFWKYSDQVYNLAITMPNLCI